MIRPHLAESMNRLLTAIFFTFVSSTLSFAAEIAATNDNSFPVSIRIDLANSKGPLRQPWRFFGADEPNYATMKNGRKLIGELGALSPKRIYFRTHNLLNSGDGTPALKWGSTGVYSEDENGQPIYNWTILDGIFDTYLQHGVRPYAQLGFMPKALSIHPEPYQHHWNPSEPYSEIFTGWAYPPKDYSRWSELAYQWTKHCVEKYGRAEVESWYWETWNEPNIGYWKGTPEEFRKLHDYAIAGVRRALPTARVGGADTAGDGGKFTRNFIEHCLRGTNFATGKIGTPLDFVSFHAKGSPVFTNGHVRMGIANQLRTIRDGFRIVASFPELKHTPIIIGESDPEGCAACQGDQLGYRNGTMYSSYTAASFLREHDLADQHGVNFEGALTWAFEFEDQPFFAGFRALASNGIDLPVLNVFRMFSRMSGERIAVESDGEIPLNSILRRGVREHPDVAGLASRDGQKLCVLLWHYHDDDVPGPDAELTLTFSGMPSAAKIRAQQFRIDRDHSNAYAAWQEMGSPQSPTPEQYSALEKAGKLAEMPAPELSASKAGVRTAKLKLPRQAVSLLVLQWD